MAERHHSQRAFSNSIVPILACALAGLAGCAETDAEQTESDLRYGHNQHYIYNGMLPPLEGIEMFVSLKSHTARVTGNVPLDWNGEIPFYASPKQVLDGATERTQLTVVYPIATGAMATRSLERETEQVAIFPFKSNDEFGGFPFISYVNPVNNRPTNYALHGPITSEHGEWQLVRGRVSHGCNRMQGEHVVELAHLLGVDMLRLYRDGDMRRKYASVHVRDDFDMFDGSYVDVDYPAGRGVELPQENVQKFQTWSARDFPSFVCAYREGHRPLDENYCADRGANRRDPVTGSPLQSAPVASNP